MINYNLKKFKTEFSDRPIKSKLMLMIMSVSIICTILTVLSFSIYGIINIRKEMREEISITGTIISNRINAALIFNNNSLALETLSALGANSAIRIACVFDSKGSIFAKYSSGKNSTSCPKQLGNGVLFEDKQLKLYKEITDGFNNSMIGTLYISSDLSKISNFITKQAIIALSIIIFVMAVGYFLAIKLQNIISEPIKYLVTGNKKIGTLLPEESSYFKSGNEIAKLESLFNAMYMRMQYLEHSEHKKNMQLESMIKNSESTFSYLNNELKQPLESTMAFGDIINTRSIGKIDDEYISYFNDVYLSVYYYYGIMNDTMTFFQRHVGESNKKSVPDLDILHLLERIMKNISGHQPEYLDEFNFRYNVMGSTELPKILVDRFVIKEIILNAIFVYTKYLSFLDINHLELRLNAKVDDPDSNDRKFRLEIMCKEMENHNIANVLENHRDYQNDVHLIRAKLQFLKYLASYNGAYLDFGDDMRYMFKMVLILPYDQVVVAGDSDLDDTLFNEMQKFSQIGKYS